jgi:ligand-binding sensor domain-containing protein
MKNIHTHSVYRYVLCFSAFVTIIALQSVNVSAASISGKTFTSSNHSFTAIVCDNHYLWAGTCGEGLFRIDKNSGQTGVYTSSNSGLTDDCIRALALDKDGALLVGTTYSGTVRFNGTKWEQVGGLFDNGTGFSYNNVRGLTVDNQGEIWALTQGGFARFSTGAWQPVINRTTGMLASSPAGNVWIFKFPMNSSPTCDDGWIYEYVNGGLQSTISLKLLFTEKPFCTDFISPQCFVADNKNNCWINGQNDLIKINAQSVKRFPLSTDTSVQKSITALAVNNNDVLLIALTNYSGKSEIFFYDQIDGKRQTFDSLNSFTLNTGYITAACSDVNGDFWCAASDGRIIKFAVQLSYPIFFKTGDSVLPGNSIASLLIDKSNDIWVATNNGIARCHDTSWTTYPASGDTMPGLDASSLAMDSSGTVWAGFRQSPIMSSIRSGISYYKEGHWRQLVYDHFSIKAIAIDKSSDLWFVSIDGVHRYHENQSKLLFEMVPSSDMRTALGTTVNTIAFDSSNIPWIGTGWGIKRYENSVWIDDTTINRFLPKSGANGVGVNCICFSNGAAWIGTTQGLFKNTGGNCIHIDTTSSLLPNQFVQCIAVKGPDDVWIGTRRGLVHIFGQEHVTYTTENTPLIDNDITACAVAPNGDVWVGTRLGGLTVLKQSETALSDAVSKGSHGIQPVDIMLSAKGNHCCRVSVRTNITAPIGLSVYSLQGKLIRRFAAASNDDNGVTFIWNGTDCLNRPVAEGLYLGIISVNGKIAGKKILPR